VLRASSAPLVSALLIFGMSELYGAVQSMSTRTAPGDAFSETADLAVETPSQKMGLVAAAVAGPVVVLVVDSVVFLGLAFGSLAFLPGQIVGKLWMVLAFLPLLRWLRGRVQRLGLAPA